MRTSKIIVILLLSILLFSCAEKAEKNSKAEEVESLEPKVNFNELESDFMKW